MTQKAGTELPMTALAYGDVGTEATAVSPTNPLPVTAALASGAATDASLQTLHSDFADVETLQSAGNTSLASLVTAMGAVTASPAANTLLDRLKTIATNTASLLTGTILAAGAAIIGKVGIDQTTPGTTNAVNPKPVAGQGLLPSRVFSGTSGFIKNSAGTLFHIPQASNVNAAVRYLHLYNKASAPTLGTDTPVASMVMHLGDMREIDFGYYGLAFSTGIAWAFTTDNIAIPTTAGASLDFMATFLYI